MAQKPRRYSWPFGTRKCDVTYLFYRGARWRSGLRHCATGCKVAGSIPDGVIGICPSGRNMALRSIQPPTEMSTTNSSWGVKAAGAYG
jgi:hypothetical protein